MMYRNSFIYSTLSATQRRQKHFLLISHQLSCSLAYPKLRFEQTRLDFTAKLRTDKHLSSSPNLLGKIQTLFMEPFLLLLKRATCLCSLEPNQSSYVQAEASSLIFPAIVQRTTTLFGANMDCISFSAHYLLWLFAHKKSVTVSELSDYITRRKMRYKMVVLILGYALQVHSWLKCLGRVPVL